MLISWLIINLWFTILAGKLYWGGRFPWKFIESYWIQACVRLSPLTSSAASISNRNVIITHCERDRSVMKMKIMAVDIFCALKFRNKPTWWKKKIIHMWHKCLRMAQQYLSVISLHLFCLLTNWLLFSGEELLPRSRSSSLRRQLFIYFDSLTVTTDIVLHVNQR